MFESSKKRYLTKGVNETIPFEIQLFLWEAIDRMPQPKDYLQIFRLFEMEGMQVVEHSAEQPEYKMHYVLTNVNNIVSAKVYVIDSEEYCIMLLAEEY